MDEVENALETLSCLRRETRPIEKHTDPGAIEDCFNVVEDALRGSLDGRSDDALLQELVDRGRIHESRLREHHIVRVGSDAGYWMAHPLSCDLGDCPFDRLAARWSEAPVAPGTYYWPDPTIDSLREQVA